MTMFQNFYGTPGLLVLAAALFLPVVQLAVLLIYIRDRQDKKRILFSGCHFVFGFLILVLLLDGNWFPDVPEESRRFSDWEMAVFSLPVLFCAVPEILSAGILFLNFRDIMKYRNTHLTPGAIQSALDLIPKGIAVIAPDGTVRLANLEMNTLCRTLTGNILLDASRFWQRIEDTGKERNGLYMVLTRREAAWVFAREPVTVGGKQYYRITASDMTARYRVTRELREKNEHLKEVQRRMKAVSELSGGMFAAEEEANARADLHSQLGQVLLMGRHYLTHPESTDAEMVYMMTQEMNRFLLGEAEENYLPEEGEKLQTVRQFISRAVQKAEHIGVRVDIHGELPSSGAGAEILSMVIEECAANAVKHADGNLLTVELTEASGFTGIAVENNGKPPEGSIEESGGLLALRRRTEEAGGSMTVKSIPVFRLEIRVPVSEM